MKFDAELPNVSSHPVSKKLLLLKLAGRNVQIAPVNKVLRV